ncbi:alpha/beta fold hydrolase [Arenimonas sp.]|uniref:alpha/beta fold hydrolase n=1 Tax=Arenimonas sp. TaxID=1872635 RepID=UPI0039E5CFA4
MKKGRVALAVSFGLALTTVGVAAYMPERVLDAEFARQRWLAGASQQSLEAAGHRWSYLQAGQDGPLVVLVHGFTGSKENWLPLMRELAKTHRVIAPDLPGWGESERQAGADYGPLAQAQRLQEFLAKLPGKPALLVGHSMGGQIVGLLAARQADIADRLVLMSSAGVRFNENQFGREVLAGQNPFEVTSRAELHRYLGIVFTDPPFVPWPADEAFVRRRRADAPFEQSVLDAIGRGPEATQLQSELAQITAPVLLLWCKDDRVIDVSSVPIFEAGLPDSRAVLFSGCGHMPMMARPKETAKVLQEFAAPNLQ